MNKRTINGITLLFASGEQDTADLIGEACNKAIKLSRENWGLESPRGCYIYVMTSWLGFIFQSAPWSWRIMLGATMPFWCFRARRTWPYSAGWTQRYGKKVAIGVKPPRLLEQSDRSIGIRLLVEHDDMSINIQQVTCHELVHACSAHLMLPMWLNEGIAVATVDRFMEKQMIRQETLDLVRDYSPKASPPSYRQLSRMDRTAIAYHSIRGYWLVRYLEEKCPGFLKHMFSLHPDSKTIESRIAAGLGMQPENFWSEIDDLLVDYFEKKRV